MQDHKDKARPNDRTARERGKEGRCIGKVRYVVVRRLVATDTSEESWVCHRYTVGSLFTNPLTHVAQTPRKSGLVRVHFLYILTIEHRQANVGGVESRRRTACFTTSLQRDPLAERYPRVPRLAWSILPLLLGALAGLAAGCIMC